MSLEANAGACPYTSRMPRSLAREQDILRRRPPKRPPRLTSRRIGIHTSSAGGVQNAAERAYRLGCNTFQIFSSSPRQWAPYELGEPQCAEMNRLRARYNLKPLVIHTNYLMNLASSNESFLRKSMEAFRGEVQRAHDLISPVYNRFSEGLTTPDLISARRILEQTSVPARQTGRRVAKSSGRAKA